MPDPASQRCALWILRILDRVSDHPALRDRLRHLPRETVAACGLPEWHTRDGHRFRRIRARRRQLERTAREPLGAPLDRVQVLADVLGLAPAERDLLAFFVAAAAF